MREGIHPQYNQVTVKCNRGNEFVTGWGMYAIPPFFYK